MSSAPSTADIRFGVVARTASTASEWRTKVQRFEAQGYDILYVPDHVTGDRLAPLPALAVAAGVTTRLRLSTMVLANDFRHPLMLAKEGATLDLLSDGRFELGIGAGWMAADYEMTGLAYEAPGTRIARLAEALRLIKAAWLGEPFNTAGKFYTSTGVEQWPRPVQNPHPPILLGGAGAKMLHLAGEQADIVNVTMRTSTDGAGVVAEDVGRAQFFEKLDLLSAAAGPRRKNLRISVSIQSLTRAPGPDGLDSRNEYSREHVERLRGTPFVLEGTADDMAEQVLRWHSDHGIGDFVIHDERDADIGAEIIDRIRCLS